MFFLFLIQTNGLVFKKKNYSSKRGCARVLKYSINGILYYTVPSYNKNYIKRNELILIFQREQVSQYSYFVTFNIDAPNYRAQSHSRLFVAASLTLFHTITGIVGIRLGMCLHLFRSQCQKIQLLFYLESCFNPQILSMCT